MKISKSRKSIFFNFKFLTFNSRRAGFTLIEVLLSLVLLTVMLGAVYGSFFSVQKALERFNGVSLKYQEARTALDIMRREIEAAFFSAQETLNAERRTFFIIEDRDIFGKPASRLRLTAFNSRGGGVSAVSYFVEEKDKKLRLIKAESPAALSVKEHPAEIIDEITGFAVETFFNDNWVRTWDTAQTDKLPEIVRVSITFNDNGKDITLTEYAMPMTGRAM
ncbi:MAG: prepilin-type N-terminal cleavage/methylation domain-containing protein [Nitrospirae bacterium]|nr:prepilin-type N-terminal cleavage/methylation domain-containing protein [Nitrospirota bacterium]